MTTSLRFQLLVLVLVLAGGALVATPALAQDETALAPSTRAILDHLATAAITVTATDSLYEDQVEVFWPGSGEFDVFYRVYRIIDATQDTTLLSVLSSEDTTLVDMGGDPGFEYRYAVHLVDVAADTTLDMGSDFGSRRINPPGSVTATDGTLSVGVRVSWFDNSFVEAGYSILRRNSGSGAFTEIATTLANEETYLDMTAIPDTVYDYRVVAFDAMGFESREGEDSGFAGFVVPPGGVFASDGTYSDRVRIRWTDQSPDETGFKIYRNGNVIGSVGLDVTSFEDTDSLGLGHVYAVAAVVDTGGPVLESVRISDPGIGGPGTLAGGANLEASDNEFDDKVVLVWEDVSPNEDGWKIERDNVHIATLEADTELFEDIDAQIGVTHNYGVYAFSDSGGTSAKLTDSGRRSVILAPQNVQASDGTHEGYVEITWESSATSVVLFKILRDGTPIRTVNGTVRSAVDSDIASGTTYTYCVVAVTAFEDESPSGCDDGYRELEPPTDVAASDDAYEDQVLVTWKDRSKVETGYNIYRRVAGSGSYSLIGQRGAGRTAFVDALAEPGVTYDYEVETEDATGASLRGGDTGSRRLAAPTELTASDATFETKVELSWLDNSRFETGYLVLRRPAGTSATPDTAGTLAANAMSFTDTGMDFGVVYDYSVVPFDSLGVSMGSEAVDSGYSDILPPLSVNASDYYTNKIVVTWADQSAIETGYLVERRELGSATGFAILDTTAAGAESYTDNGASAGVEYEYCVTTLSGSIQSDSDCDVGFYQAPVVSNETVVSTFLDAPSVTATSRFGFDVAMEGDYAIVGARDHNTAGAVFFFEREDNGWVQMVQFAPPQSGVTDFGKWVDMRGDYALAAAGNGDVYVYELTQSGEWVYYGEAAGVGFGQADHAVALGDDMLAFSLTATLLENNVSSTQRMVNLMSIDGDGAFTNIKTIIDPARNPATQFGDALELREDNELYVGAPGDNAALQGSVMYIYIKTGGAWQDVYTTFLFYGGPGQGTSIDIDGSAMVVGNSVHQFATVYSDAATGNWSNAAILNYPEAGTAEFGASVAIWGGYVVVGAPEGNASGAGPGAVFLFQQNPDGSWPGFGGGDKFVSSTASNQDDFGRAVAMDAGTFLFGGSRDDVLGNASGSVAIFELNKPPTDVTASDATYDDRIQIRWKDRSTLETGEDGFNIYRDGILIETTAANIQTYNDFEAEPGRSYEYGVTSLRGGEETEPVTDFGRRAPNGSITGRVETQAGTPVAGVEVCLDPTPNGSMLFDGSGMAVSSDLEIPGDFTIEFWANTGNLNPLSNWVTLGTSNSNRFRIGFGGGVGQVTSYSGPSDGGTVSGINTSVTLPADTWIHWAVVVDQGTNMKVYKDGLLYATLSASVEVQGTRQVKLGGFAGRLDDVRIWGTQRSAQQIADLYQQPLSGTEDGLLGYWKLDEGVGRLAADAAPGQAYAELDPGAHWSVAGAPITACAVTDLEGNYAHNNLRYGESTTIKVFPELPNRVFEPGFKTITLSTQSPVQNEVAFRDISSYTIAGFVRLQNVTLDSDAFCFAQNVEILVDGEVAGTTDGSGNFAVAVTVGSHTIEPRFQDHTFSPAELVLDVAADTSGVEFTDTTLRSMAGRIGGGCDLDIGDLEIEIVSENGCFMKDDYVGVGGDYEIQLPPQTYFVTVRDVINIPAGLDKADILQFFDDLGTREINLAEADTTLDFVYRAPIRVRIAGFDPAPTGCTVPVLAQGDQVSLNIEVFEDYGPGNECPVDSAVVTIYDEILDEADAPTVLTVENGVASYTTAANTPNVFAGRRDADGNDRSYQKPITAVADVGGVFGTRIEWVIVTGHRPRIPTFTSISEEIPLMVLRDPPGDNSFAFLEEGTSSCTEVQNLGLENLETQFLKGIKTGIKFEKGSPFWTTETETAVKASDKITIGVEATQGDGLTICATTTETFSTSSDEIFAGRNGDVYVGVALNLVFAKTDVVEFDPQTCQIIKSEEITVGGDDNEPFETIYIYTDDHIRNVVIPQLREIAASSSNPDTTILFESYADNWQSNHLDYNEELKQDADFVENRSFSAGADYTATSSTDTTDTFDWSFKVYAGYEGSAAFQFEESGSGTFTQFVVNLNGSYTRAEGSSETNTRTVGYTLSDDDVGDFFSVDIKEDPDYGTPVFNVVSGTSSCPWEPWYNAQGEPKMQPRDKALLAIEPQELREVPPEETATLTLSLTNDSQSGESREYILRPIQATNPGGAILAANGTGFANGISFFIEPQQTQEVTLTVKRGPRRYLYENIELQLVSPCEYARWQNGGPLQLADTVSFTVEFDAACSEIDLFRPLSDWKHNANDGDTLEVILDEFDFSIGQLDSIVTQSVGAEYRLVGNDIWFPIETIQAANLPADSEGDAQSVSILWDISNLAQEGRYEIRGFTRCEGGSNFSLSATGILDQTAPKPFGAPAPADSVLSLGEEIKITFAERILCESLNAANVTLHRINADQSLTPVQIDVDCSGSSVILTPVSPTLAALEGKTLIASITGVRDLAGNIMEARDGSGTEVWQFQVRQSAFTWAQATLARQVSYRSPGTISADLVNGTTVSQTFTIEDEPEWLTPSPTGATVLAEQTIQVSFEVADTLSLGSHADTLRAVVRDGNLQIVRETPLFVQLEVVCRPPVWEVNPADFEQSMTIVAQVSIGGQISDDPNDRIAAFVGNELRGVGAPVLVNGLGDYLVFLTVHGNRVSGESVRFKVYDESECRLYSASDRTFAFVSDGSYGTPEVPELIVARDIPPSTIRSIPVNEGWTWLSFNLLRQDMSVDGVLGDLNPASGDILKSQTAFSQFDPDLGWAGGVNTFDNRSGYLLRVSDAGTIALDGAVVPPDSTDIPVVNGWNWVGYTPQVSMSVNDALAELSPSDDDVIKGQYGFAQYLQVNNNVKGWYGNLQTMTPGRGYKLKLRNAINSGGSFQYPVNGSASTILAEGRPDRKIGVGGLTSSDQPWTLDPHAFQYNMTVTAAVNMDGETVVGTSLVLLAYAGEELRGFTNLREVPGLEGARAFLMVYGNNPEEEALTLKVYDPATGNMLRVEENIDFAADGVLGDLRTPFVANTSQESVEGVEPSLSFRLLRMSPNPLPYGVNGVIRFSMPTDEHVCLRVFDLQGRLVRTIVDEPRPAGEYEAIFDSSNLSSGVYFYRLQAGSYGDGGRVVIVK